MLNHLFTTPILAQSTGLTREQLAEIRDYVLSLRANSASEKVSNRGGWHSPGNLFGPEYRQIPALRDAIMKTVLSYVGDVFHYQGNIQLTLTGWTIVNRAGDYNLPHNHAANLLSGALYIVVPQGMTGGNISFQDPRINLNAHETDGMRRLGISPPWMTTNVSVVPVEGEIIVFPSWLVHWVEPYQVPSSDGMRIVISFNVTVA